MRIISGKYKGRTLKAPTQKSIRPTTDRAKEALFNIIRQKINSECIIIDAFCGSGAVGIEALSRGVRKVIFIDNNKDSIRLLKNNLQGIDGDYEILCQDYLSAFKQLSADGVKADIIFCDPPYQHDLSQVILDALNKNKIIKYSGIVVIEKNKIFSPTLTSSFYHYDERVYASTRFDFYSMQKRCAITGTFDPFTKGHLALVQKAKEIFDKVYIVLLINEKKTIRYSLEKRKEIIRTTTKDIQESIVIDSYDGLAIDYCNNNNIQYIMRGIRNANDMAYEYEMAEYNHKNGGVETLILLSKYKDISSSTLKEKLDKGQDINKYINASLIELLKD